MNIELKDRVSNMALWSSPKQKSSFLEGLNFCRILIKTFIFKTNILIGYRELFFLKRHPELIHDEWWGKRIYAFHPKSLKKCKHGFANVFCLSLLNKSTGPMIYTHEVVSTVFTFKDYVGYIRD